MAFGATNRAGGNEGLTLYPLHARLNLFTWSWDPTVIAGTLALAAAYAWLVRRRGTGSTEWSPMARIYFAGGLLCLFLALESPIDVGGDHYLFSLHMLQHVILAMIVPPLLLLGLPERWLALVPFRVSALAANVGFNLVLAVWHLPFLYQATLHNELIHVGEHLTFLAAGVVFWWPILAAPRTGSSLSTIGKIAYLGFAGVPPTILGLAFILSPTVIYPFYAAAARVTALSALDDQVLAGLVMFGLGNIIYFVAISIIFFSLDDKRATAGLVDQADAARPAAVELDKPVTLQSPAKMNR